MATADAAHATGASLVDAVLLRGLSRAQQIKTALLCAWFFLTIVTLSLLKPVRVASLLVHLGARETPYVRLAGVATVAIVVAFYSWVLNRLSRLGTVVWANAVFGSLLIAFWTALQVGGPALGAQRPFVWAVYILVEIYSVVLVGIFWTYANDIVTESESNRLYGAVGIGGILGGAAGGAFVDLLTARIGGVNLLLICAGLVIAAPLPAFAIEKIVRPPPRRMASAPDAKGKGWLAAFEGAREVRASQYLFLIVAIVVTYEFAATLTDFAISVVLEHTYRDEVLLTRMYGRLGWIVSATALAGQLFLVPVLLPRKRIALLLPPLAMLIGASGLTLFPVAAVAMFLAASDRGFNYSVHQATKESLYVPLTDTQKYKSKAFIDMFVDRAAKALAAFVLIALIARYGESVYAPLAVSMLAMGVWLFSAWRLGAFHRHRHLEQPPSER